MEGFGLDSNSNNKSLQLFVKGSDVIRSAF